MGKGDASAGQKVYDRYAIIACAVCAGPVKALRAIIIDDKQVWPPDGAPALVRNETNNLGVDVPVEGWGNPIRWYWGTSNQPRDPTLNTTGIVGAEMHPSYAGICYAVLGAGSDRKGFLFGRERETAPNIQFIVEREAQVAGTSYIASPGGFRLLASQGLLHVSSLTGGGNLSGQCNPAVALLELYQDSNPSLGWPGWDADVWSTAANYAQTIADRLYLSPLLTSAVDLSEAASTIALHADIHISVDAQTGKLLPAVRRHDGGAISPVIQLDADDLSEPAKVNTENVPGDVTGWSATFHDRERNYKESAVTVDDATLRGYAGETRRESLRRPFITGRNQLTWHVTEWGRTQGGDVLSVSMKVLSWVAAGLKPGDWITLDIAWTPDVAASLRDFWIVEITRPYEGPVTIKAVSDGSRTAQTTAPVIDVPTNQGIVPPLPITDTYIIEIPPTFADDMKDRLLALSERPDGLTKGMQAWYSRVNGGVEPTLIATTRFFPLRGTLALALDAFADTWVSSTLVDGLLPPLPANHPLQITIPKDKPDNQWIEEVTGPDAARNNQLLLFVVSPRATIPRTFEIFSVGQIQAASSTASTTTYLIRAFRGRSTLTYAHLVNAELYLLPVRHIVPLYHADFPNLRNGTTGSLRLLAYTAYAIRQYAAGEDVNATVALTLIAPGAPVITWSAPVWPTDGSSLVISALNTPIPLVARIDDSDNNLAEYTLTILRPNGTETTLLNGPVADQSTFSVQSSFTPDVVGRWVVRLLAVDGSGHSTLDMRPVDVGAVPGTTLSPEFIPWGGQNKLTFKLNCRTVPSTCFYYFDDERLPTPPPLGSGWIQYPTNPPANFRLHLELGRTTKVWAYAVSAAGDSPIVFASFYNNLGGGGNELNF